MKDKLDKSILEKVKELCKKDSSKDYHKELGKAVKLAKLGKIKKGE